MLQQNMPIQDLEDVYDLIAEGLDEVGSERRELFLAKLSFALANLVGQAEMVKAAIDAAKRDIC